MRRNAKSLNNGECQGILIGPSMAPHFLDALKFLRHKFFTCCSTQEVGFRHKFRGTDGKPMMNSISTLRRTQNLTAVFFSRAGKGWALPTLPYNFSGVL